MELKIIYFCKIKKTIYIDELRSLQENQLTRQLVNLVNLLTPQPVTSTL